MCAKSLMVLVTIIVPLMAMGQDTTSTTDKAKSQIELVKAQTEAKKVENDSIKITDARRQFYVDFVYRLLLLVVAIYLLKWLVPQFQEFSIPFGGGTFSAKKAPKEPKPADGGTLPPGVQTVTSTTEFLNKDAPQGQVKDKLVSKLNEMRVYQEAGVSKDTVYLCHRAKKIPRIEYYRVQIYLDADDVSTMDKIEKVVYQLPPAFARPSMTIADRNSQFLLEITAWGEFMLSAMVYFKKPSGTAVELKRYLNL